jgi:DNA repair exonuclease SbcCD ATPase subunit
METENKDYQGRAEKLLRDLGKKIDELISKTFEERGELKEDLNRRLEELKRNKEKLESEIRGFVSKNESTWKDVEIRLQNAADELKKALEIIFQKTPKEKP